MEEILQYLINGVTYGSIYALIALGFTVIYKTTDCINFAQGEFIMLGGMFMYTFQENCGISTVSAVFLSIISVSIIGIIIEKIFIRPALKFPPIAIIIITIGLSIVLQTTAMLVWGKNALIIKPFSKSEIFQINDNLFINAQNIWIIFITIILMILLHLFFEKTMYGKGFTACSSNPIAASLVGIDRKKMVMFSFGLSAGLGAIGGAILCPLTNVNYSMGVLFGLKGFCAAIIGGLGNNIGAILGGFMLGIIQETGAGIISSSYKDAISFILLILFLILRPTGILGSRWTQRV